MDRYHYLVCGGLPAEKYQYHIFGCGDKFVRYDTSKLDEKYQNDVVSCSDIYDDSGMFVKQCITIEVPKHYFDINMQYICIKQNKDTSLMITDEEHLDTALDCDTACRVQLPVGYFALIREKCLSCDEDLAKPIEEFLFLNLFLYSDGHLFLEPL